MTVRSLSGRGGGSFGYVSHSSIGGSSARGYVMGMDDTVQRNDENPRQMGHRKHCHARDGLYKGGGVTVHGRNRNVVATTYNTGRRSLRCTRAGTT